MTVDPSKLAVREAPRPKAKRVYKTVSVSEEEGAYRVLLDGKPVRTPARNVLQTKSRALAEAVAREWDAQKEEVDPTAMPVMRLVATSLDRIAPQRDAVITELLKFVDADLLAYRAANPADLKARQNALWQPVVDWLAASHGIASITSNGIMPQGQAPDVSAKFKAAFAALDDDQLTALQACASATSSLTLALALVHGRVSPREVCAAAHLDEIYQMEKWGEDKLALDRRRGIEADIEAIGVFLALLKA